MIGSKLKLFVAVAASLMWYQVPAVAWDGAVAGQIVQIDGVAEPSNFETRVYLANTTAICSSGQNWGYLNSSDANYKGVLAILLTAYVAGKRVTVYTMSEGGYCHIHYVVMS